LKKLPNFTFSRKNLNEMEKEKILARTKDLPIIMGGQITEDWQIWEGEEAGVRFKITKEIVPIPQGETLYMLSVSGPSDSKEKVISDFIAAFGQPFDRFTIPEVLGVDYISWDAKVVDEGEK
jgi:hypothetical protein